MERSLPIKRKSAQSSPAKARKKETCNCPTYGKAAESACIECDWCGLWEHSQCSGLSAKDLKVLGDLPSNVMFFCTVCHPKVTLAFKFFNDIQENQNSVDDKLQLLEEKLIKTVEEFNSHIKKLQENSASEPPPAPAPVPVTKQPAVSSGTRQRITDRSSNVVVYGIKESETGTKRPDRKKADFDNIMHTFSSANVSIQASSIRDFYRLIKFRHDQSRPRPILIKYLRVFDAEAVLSKRSSFCAPIVIKQDMTKEERLVESILLREQWNLVQNGTDRKFIKIRNTQIFVHNKLHGSVQGSKFQACQHTNSNNSTNSQSHDQPPMEQDTSAN